MDTSSWPAFFYSLLGTPRPLVALLSAINWIALLVAVTTPTIILYSRHEIRIRRLRQIQDFYHNFTAPCDVPQGLATNPSFEFVRSKYTADLKLSEEDQQVYDTVDESGRLKILIKAAENREVSFGFRLFISAFGFIAISYFGFDILGKALVCGLNSSGQCLGATTQPNSEVDALLIIASLTFAGAYIASVRTMLSRLSLFDLSSNTFLRVTGETIASIIVTVVLYAALSTTMSALGGAVAGTPTTGDTGIPLLWLAAAVLLGLIPQSSTKFLLVRLQEKINWIKTTDDRFVEITRSTSPEVIDGIDYDTRFRLEECGIFDVQNLATYNPILMHIETPYSIYQCIDWIAQAQLCHIVGLERFLILRELNIRTIFDLERAIDSVHSPAQFDDIYSSVLFAPTERLRQAVTKSEAMFIILRKDQGAQQLTVDEFCKWSREQISTNSGLLSEAAEHLMCWITDDLHVRRLRRLWNDIASSLEPGSNYFDDSKRNPANKDWRNRAIENSPSVTSIAAIT